MASLDNAFVAIYQKHNEEIGLPELG